MSDEEKKVEIEQPKPEVHAVFCGEINQNASHLIAKHLSMATVHKVPHLHLLLQSGGGSVSDGIFLYNLLHAMPIEITLYNAGRLASAAVVAYMGARRRKTTANATFMLHRSTQSAQWATATRLQHLATSVMLDDERIDKIFRERIELPDELWTELKYHDVYLSGTEAVEFGIADSIGEFSPPFGTRIFQMMD